MSTGNILFILRPQRDTPTCCECWWRATLTLARFLKTSTAPLCTTQVCVHVASLTRDTASTFERPLIDCFPKKTVINKNHETTKYLIDVGAIPNLKDIHRRTPRQYAVDEEIMRLVFEVLSLRVHVHTSVHFHQHKHIHIPGHVPTHSRAHTHTHAHTHKHTHTHVNCHQFMPSVKIFFVPCSLY